MTHRARMLYVADCIATRDFDEITDVEFDVLEALARKADISLMVESARALRNALIVAYCDTWLPTADSWPTAKAFQRQLNTYRAARWRGNDEHARENPHPGETPEHDLWRVLAAAPLSEFPTSTQAIVNILDSLR